MEKEKKILLSSYHRNVKGKTEREERAMYSIVIPVDQPQKVDKRTVEHPAPLQSKRDLTIGVKLQPADHSSSMSSERFNGTSR